MHPRTRIITLILSLLFLLPFALSITPLITAPANGTSIKPGAAFDFAYQSIADYGISSYNYTVWLFTQPPAASFAPLSNYAMGHYFGRFAEPNYPGNPDPSNLPPAKLIMPDFAVGRGFGSGAHTHDATFYLTVMEEYATGDGTLGYRISLSYNYVHYNTTGHH